jgi:hypothetical protein
MTRKLLKITFTPDNDPVTILLYFKPKGTLFKQGVKPPPSSIIPVPLIFQYIPSTDVYAAFLDDHYLSPSLRLKDAPIQYPLERLEEVIRDLINTKQDLTARTCLRCGNVWTPRSAKSDQCTKCRTRLWDQPKSGNLALPTSNDADAAYSEIIAKLAQLNEQK